MEEMEYIEIPLSGKYGEGKVTLVDGDYDGEYFSCYKWIITKAGYVATNFYDPEIKGKRWIYLHDLVCYKPTGMWIDHIDRNRLNNRSCNLRAVSPSVNARNCDRYEMLVSSPTYGRRTVGKETDSHRKYRMSLRVRQKKAEYDKQRYYARKKSKENNLFVS